MKNALILQGWPQKITQHWYPWLAKELEILGYKVLLLELPTMLTDAPNMNIQLDYIEKVFDFNDQSIVIGHSLGTLLTMRLAEKHIYKKMILVAGFDFNDLTEGLESFWSNPINHSKIIENTSERFVIHSDNDPYVTKLTAEEMSKRLEAKLILIPKGGHFMEEDGYAKISELLNLITD
jgi:predicted alpha/beta hydrolase family esterase